MFWLLMVVTTVVTTCHAFVPLTINIVDGQVNYYGEYQLGTLPGYVHTFEVVFVNESIPLSVPAQWQATIQNDAFIYGIGQSHVVRVDANYSDVAGYVLNVYNLRQSFCFARMYDRVELLLGQPCPPYKHSHEHTRVYAVNTTSWQLEGGRWLDFHSANRGSLDAVEYVYADAHDVSYDADAGTVTVYTSDDSGDEVMIAERLLIGIK